MKEIRFDEKTEGRTFQVIDPSADTMALLTVKRKELIDIISGIDDELAENIIASESLDDVDNKLLLNAIRRGTVAQKIVPVLLGSAYKNSGIQPLLDAIVNFLPVPHERNSIYSCFE